MALTLLWEQESEVLEIKRMFEEGKSFEEVFATFPDFIVYVLQTKDRDAWGWEFDGVFLTEFEANDHIPWWGGYYWLKESIQPINASKIESEECRDYLRNQISKRDKFNLPENYKPDSVAYIEWTLVFIQNDQVVFPDNFTQNRDYFIVYSSHRGSKWLCNQQGEITIPVLWKDISRFPIEIAGNNKKYYQVGNNGNYTAIYEAGGRLAQPEDYEVVKVVLERFFIAKRWNKRGTYGVFDLNWKEIIPCEYEHILVCDNGFFSVIQNSKHALFDLKGNRLTEHKYYSILEKGDYFNVSMGAYWPEGVLDTTGKEIIPCVWDDIFIMNSLGYSIAFNKIGDKDDNENTEIEAVVYDGSGKDIVPISRYNRAGELMLWIDSELSDLTSYFSSHPTPIAYLWLRKAGLLGKSVFLTDKARENEEVDSVNYWDELYISPFLKDYLWVPRKKIPVCRRIWSNEYKTVLIEISKLTWDKGDYGCGYKKSIAR